MPFAYITCLRNASSIYSNQPCSSRGVSGDSPVGGARRGVPRLRLVTVRLGRQGTPPARHYDLAARSIALRMRRKCRKLKRGPGPKSPRWSAERRASPRHGGAGAFAKAPRRAASITARRGCASCTRAPVGAPPPLDRGGKKRSNPGRKRVAGTEVCCSSWAV